MPIKAIIFDFGGVLVRFRDRPGQRQWEERLGLQADELGPMVFATPLAERATLGLVPEIALWQRIAERFGLNDAAMRQIEQDFWLGEFLDAELVDLLGNARPQYKTAILSNAWSDARTAFIGKFGLDQVTDTMILSAEEGLAKPDARIYHLACERLGVQPDQAIFVDDLAENIEGARALGMKGVLFESTEQALAEIRGYLDDGNW